MVRQPAWHVFEPWATSWPNVEPGDVVISPETRFYRLNEYIGRTKKTRNIITQHRPLIVIARIDKAVDDEQIPDDYSTFVVLSVSAGFLVTVMSRGDK